MKSDKITVVVPVYNLEESISRSVESICNQTYDNLEIIIVDDGSTDGSRDVIERLAGKDERIIPLFKKNGGVTSARLAGVRAATGDWIGFVDGDDEIEPDMYEFLIRNAVDSQAQISHCGYQMIFPDGRVNYFHNTALRVEHDKITALKELLSGSRIEPGLCNKLFHKTLFHSLLHDGVMDTTIKINEDLLMNFIVFSEANKSVFEDRCPYHYIVRYSSASRQSLNQYQIYDPIKVKQYIVDHAAEELQGSAKAAYLATCINVYNTLTCDGGNRTEDKKKIRQMIKKRWMWRRFLSPKMRVLGILICYFSVLYPVIYRTYAENFQVRKYA